MTNNSLQDASSQTGQEGPLAIVWTTTADAEQAETIAGELVQRRLAACVQTDGPVRSTYFWKGHRQVENEYRLAIKTSSQKVCEVMDWLAANHPYEEPEILVTAVIETSPGYRQWVFDQTR